MYLIPASEDLTFLLRNTYKRRLFLLKKVIPTARKLALEQQKAEEGEGAEGKRLLLATQQSFTFCAGGTYVIQLAILFVSSFSWW